MGRNWYWYGTGSDVVVTIVVDHIVSVAAVVRLDTVNVNIVDVGVNFLVINVVVVIPYSIDDDIIQAYVPVAYLTFFYTVLQVY